MSDECSDICKNSAYHICKCSCNGDNHGENLQLESTEIRLLQGGHINILRHKEKLGGELEAVLNFREYLQVRTENCSCRESNSYIVGSHALILARPHRGDRGTVKDAYGIKYWLIVVCPFCDYQISLNKFLLQKSVREQANIHLKRCSTEEREMLEDILYLECQNTGQNQQEDE